MISDPALFHLHHARDSGDINFWKDLADETGSPILELGCGTGRLLTPLHKAGHRVFGLDLNFPALAFSKKSAELDFDIQVQVFQSRMECFHLSERFRMIFLACNTLSTLSSETRKNTYELVGKHLTADGVFVASLPNPTNLEDLPAEGAMEIEDTLTHPVTGNPVQVISGWEKTETRIVFRWNYDHLYPDGRVVRNTAETKHALISLEEYITELNNLGFKGIRLFGDYDRSEYSGDSTFVILIGNK
jgi:SAM-dependent methyltransferase